MKMHNRSVLIRPHEGKEMLDNGIVVDTVIGNRMQIVTGEVIQFADDIPSAAFQIEDIAYYPLYGARVLSIRGETYHVVCYDDIEMSEKKT
jgi:hypothetical protein